MPTRKRNQIDIDLSRISDKNVKDALVQLVHVMNDLVGKGLETEGTVLARGGIASGSADDSVVTMRMTVLGTLPPDSGGADHYRIVKVPGRIVAVSGWCQGLGAGDDWRGLSRASVTNTIYLSQSMGADERTIYLVNADAVHSNGYRVSIEYVPDTINRESRVTDV